MQNENFSSAKIAY